MSIGQIAATVILVLAFAIWLGIMLAIFGPKDDFDHWRKQK